ncbi:hypothetical protein [Mycobacteroides abscessus]|uniref:hypothetical protein n=1 Tax=Mycobacteroides abscessus TaxID=36809 RepID=UPI0009A5ECF3|nr:hypothetical protein [Mycobacteroides abscessus]SKH86687.1 Uncharacterised protein [Mycobacteroides abscessus subsp. massiliense]SKH90992.1 Uncharacterised protein [Mycobacteroides abscessus subsp. massiliense]SKI12222.1 Uncharacterised protein [Mycobacteroides abscessus subsp. massiliense]SKK23640.1 Uncharacterised protein [Mycobacteroides abscessus subsp. massiliense]SKK29431.1 Uncharacterised protein [Mycobacteroides abscessus subsp. massiliense]
MRYTRIDWTLSGDRTVTYDTCTICGGPINNNSISNPASLNTWVHLHRQDWAENLHQADPKGGPVQEPALETIESAAQDGQAERGDPLSPS